MSALPFPPGAPQGAADTGKRPRAKLLAAFFLSVLLHVWLVASLTWPAGRSTPTATPQFIEARVIVAQPSLDANATPTSRADEGRTPPKPVTAAAEAAPPPASRVLASRNGERASPENVRDTPSSTSPVVQSDRSAAQAQAATAAPQAPAPTLPPAPDYQLAGKLNPPPRVLDAGDPVYPPEANGEEGTVVVRVLLSRTGSVDDVAVLRALPPGLFDASALEVFRNARFAPGYLLGTPVKSQMLLELKYTPLNRGSAVSGTR